MPSPTTSGPSSSVANSGTTTIDALLGGVKWGAGPVGTAVTVTYSFPTASAVWDPSFYDGYEPDAVTYRGLNATEQAAFERVLQSFSAVANITFSKVADTPSNVGDIRIAYSSDVDEADFGGWAYYPSTDSGGGDIWLNPYISIGSYLGAGDFGIQLMAHELGHALGLKHPHELGDNGQPLMPSQYDGTFYTVMSYNEQSNWYDWGNPTGPMVYDILALQYMYGANMSYRTGNDTYFLRDDGNTYAIWDAGGIDTLDASTYTYMGVVIDLAGGSTSIVGDGDQAIGIAFGADIENFKGTKFADTVYGNDLDNILDGGAGADTLTGRKGNDTYKGDQNDNFVELAGEGIDSVEMTATAVAHFDLTAQYAHIENFRLFGALAGDITGNDDDNILTGNSGVNEIYGAGGNDTLSGAGGNDTLDGGTGDDILDGGAGVDLMLGGEGNDTYYVDHVGDIITGEDMFADIGDVVKSTVSYQLQQGLEELYLLGTAAINGTGNEEDNKIVGNDGANTLIGAGGNDTLIGGKGNDTYHVDSDGDVLVEDANAGTDTVQSSVSFVLADNFENLTLTDEGLDPHINGEGNSANNTIIGNSGDNFLKGGGGVDILKGGEGNDTYEVNLIKSGTTAVLEDTVTELAGGGDFDTIKLVGGTVSLATTTTLTAAANIENLDASGTGATRLNLMGNALNNELTGNDADNVLDGGAGDDTLTGGDGNDTYKVNQFDLVVEEDGEGVDTVEMTATEADLYFDMTTEYAHVDHFKLLGNLAGHVVGNELANIITGNAARNEITGDKGDDTLTGGAGNDVLDGGEGNDLLDGGAGDDEMSGGEGDDTYFVDSVNDVILGEEGFADTGDVVKSTVSYVLADGLEDLYLLGTASINATGNAGDNRLFGNDGANILDGGAGNDRLTGGKGNDIYVVDDYFGDIVDEAVAGIAGGVDLVKSSVAYNLLSLVNIENLTLTDDGPDLDINGFGNDSNNVITGNSGHNELGGGKGNDTIIGGDGNDTLDGGENVDTLLGGNGDDLYIVNLILAGTVAKIEDTITETTASGIDTVQLSSATLALKTATTLTLGANLENLDASGTDATLLNLTGNALDNTLTGNSADNILDGAAGKDTLAGGLGNDTYRVDQNDIVTELEDEGIDTVEMTATEVDGFIDMEADYANIENFKILGNLAINVRGNDEDNTITGNGADNELEGGKGNDKLFGGLGNDVLNGDEGDDILDGGAGADQMRGGAGNDIFYVDNVGDSILQEGDFADSGDKVYASVSYLVDDGIEYLYLVGTALNGTGTNQDDNIIVGNALNNTLSGRDGDDTLIGEAGNDILDGGLGNDQMEGGAGNDTYVVDSEDDVVNEAIAGVAGGVDLIRSSIGFDLSAHANIENLTLTDDGLDIDGTGNDGNNVIIGNSGENKLFGGKGNDTLEGRDGNDTLLGDAGIDILKGGKDDDTYIVDLVLAGAAVKLEDTVTENLNEGTDTIELKIAAPINLAAATTLTVGANIENLDASNTGTTRLNLTGNALVNVLTGNDASNILDGAAGDDVLDGGKGNDTLIGGLGTDTLTGGEGDDIFRVDENDIVSENDGEGTDTIEMTVSKAGLTVTIADFVENLKLMGALAGNVTGNDGHNNITGNAAANILEGGIGNDTLDGGAGADILRGGDGDDTYIIDNVKDVVEGEDSATGNDTVKASILLASAIADVENYTYTGSAAWMFSGTTDANTLTGGSGIDKLNGLDGNDKLVGNAGNDILDGGIDADEMIGGLGNDTYYVDDAGDVVTEDANGGTDTVISRNVEIDLTQAAWQEVENVTYLGGWNPAVMTGNTRANVLDASAADNGVVILGNAGADKLIGSAFDDELDGGDQDDTLTGGAGADILQGGAGNDTLDGGLGDDELEGGAGVDTLKGGKGNDTYLVNLVLAGTAAKLEDNVTELVGEGDADTLKLSSTTLTLAAATTLTLGANIENLDALDTGATRLNLTGNVLANVINGNDADNILDGGAGNDELRGNIGNDTLVGGLGADKLYGGSGNDLYRVDDTDTVFESAADGTDTVEMTATKAGLAFDMAASFENVENFKLMGALAGNVAGNDLDNAITGNAAANTLSGGIGDDVLSGGAGNDTLSGGDDNDLLDGGAGIDQMAGGDGDDTYVVDNVKDVVDETGTGGVDTVRSSILLTSVIAGVENYTYTGAAAWSFTANADDNVLTGGAGIDKLNGADGKDSLIGNAGDDVLDGGVGDDTLEGGLGNDTLKGGLGNDVMTGGAGNDTYYVDHADDEVVELVSGGIDTIIATTDINLDSVEFEEVEHVTYAAGWTPTTSLIGNKYNNTLNAPAMTSALIIDGGAGNDILIGGSDTDTLIGGKGNDTLTGNAGNDSLTGGEGIDVLTGGDGSDSYFVSLIQSGTGATATAKLEDTVTEAVGKLGDVDTIILTLPAAITLTKATTLTVGANFEDFDASGTADTKLNITGNALNNQITGNDADNILDGAAGNDQLFGGDGNDTLIGGLGDDLLFGQEGNDILTGGAGADTFSFDAFGEGNDVIKDFDKTKDVLSFSSILDDGDSDILDDLADALEPVGGVVDQGIGKNVILTFQDGSTLTIEKIGTGNINSVLDLDNAIQIATH